MVSFRANQTGPKSSHFMIYIGGTIDTYTFVLRLLVSYYSKFRFLLKNYIQT
ncbi:hypothetical protein Hanom_Chr02g00154261 [Helianthus anomalus]